MLRIEFFEEQQLALKKIIIPTVLIAIIVIITALLIGSNLQTPSNQQPESVIVGTEFTEANTLIFVAESMNYFYDKGLNITLKQYDSGAAVLEAIKNGEVNMGTSSEFSVANEALANSSINIFGTIDKFEQIKIMARKDKGIQSIYDLANKSVGLTFGTLAEFFFSRYLELNNLNLSQVIRVNTKPNNIVDALTNGTVDAVVSWEPQVSQIKESMAYNVVEWPAQAGQQIYCTTIATNNWINSHSETVTKFLEAIAQAENYVDSNPTDVKNILKNKLNSTIEHVEFTWPDHHFTLSLDQTLVLIMEDETRWLMANNLTNTTVMPNFRNFIYEAGLAQVKPNSVTIIW